MTGSKPVALPLGDTPLSNLPASTGSLRRQAFLQGRSAEPTGHETAPFRRQVFEGRLRGPAIAECREYAAASARHSRLAPPCEPGQRPAHFGTALGHHRLAIVSSTCLQEAANCRLGGFPCQFRSLKHLCRRYADPRKHDGEVPFWQFQGGQALTDPLAPGRLAMDEE